RRYRRSQLGLPLLLAAGHFAGVAVFPGPRLLCRKRKLPQLDAARDAPHPAVSTSDVRHLRRDRSARTRTDASIGLPQPRAGAYRQRRARAVATRYLWRLVTDGPRLRRTRRVSRS